MDKKCQYIATCETPIAECSRKSELRAKPVIKNRFWIVESDGRKVGTIERGEIGLVFSNDHSRTFFKNLAKLTNEFNIVFDSGSNFITKRAAPDLGGYPVEKSAHNILYDVKHQLYIYTKTKKSKSYHCAGYYLIKTNDEWEQSFCPKLITIQRYEFVGPFRTAKEAVL